VAVEIPPDSIPCRPDHDAPVAIGIKKYETKKGARWKVRYYKADGSEGAKSGFTTEATAKAFLRELEHGRAAGNFVDPARGRVLLEVVARQWLADRSKGIEQNAGKLTTQSRNVGIVENHIIPALGKRQVGSITQADVDDWVRSLSGEAETIRKNVSTLRGIMKLAVRSKRITTNPVVDLTLPKVVRKRKRYLSFEQVAALRSAVDRTNDGKRHGYGVMVAVLAYCGLRWSEIAGLRIRDVDLANRRIHVDHTIVLVDGKQVSGVPKSYAQREVPMSRFLANDLREHIERRRIDLIEDEATLRRRLDIIAQRASKLDLDRIKLVEHDARIARDADRRLTLQTVLGGLRADRDARIAAEVPYEALDESIARKLRSLERIPTEEWHAQRRVHIVARIERRERQVAKSERDAEILREHLEALLQEPVFVGSRTRAWLRNAQFRRGWLTPAVKLMDAEARQAALDAETDPPRPLTDIEPHELRHTCASLAVSANANVKAVQRMLGHQKASVTLDVYADLFDADLDDVADRLDEIVFAMSANTNFNPSTSEVRPIAYDDPIWSTDPEPDASEMRLIPE